MGCILASVFYRFWFWWGCAKRKELVINWFSNRRHITHMPDSCPNIRHRACSGRCVSGPFAPCEAIIRAPRRIEPKMRFIFVTKSLRFWPSRQKMCPNTRSQVDTFHGPYPPPPAPAPPLRAPARARWQNRAAAPLDSIGWKRMLRTNSRSCLNSPLLSRLLPQLSSVPVL